MEFQAPLPSIIGTCKNLDKSGAIVGVDPFHRTGDGWVYAFRREPKPEISNDLFAYAVLDYWDRVAPGEKTMLVRTIASASGAPGQAFKLPEEDVRSRLEALSRDAHYGFSYRPSAIQGLLTREKKVRADVRAVYEDWAIRHG